MHYDIFNGHHRYIFYKTDLKNILGCLNEHYPLPCKSLSLAFLPESTICDLHDRFLNDASPTDVITFSLIEGDSTAEICISVDQALNVSGELNCSLIDEITLYIVHGWLHLFGYDDRTSEQCLQMRNAEQEALSRIRQEKIKLHYRRCRKNRL